MYKWHKNKFQVILLQIIILTFYINIIYIKHVHHKAQNVQHFYEDKQSGSLHSSDLK